MIELLKEFLLFGYIEIIILLMFYKIVGNIREVKYWHSLIISPLYFICGLMTIPFMKQILMIVLMFMYLFILTKKLKFKIIICSSLFLLCIEMIICSILDVLSLVDLTSTEAKYKIILMIPIRVVEVLLILYYRKRGV